MQKSAQTQRFIPQAILLTLIAAMLNLLGGCGSGHPISNPPVPGATTQAVVLLTSTANDRLTQFQMAITGITLTDNAGKTVTLFNKPFVQNGATGLTEFMRLNGAVQPLVTATVPQGTYTSAAVKVAYCQFAFANVAAGGLVVSADAEGLCGQGTGNTTVNLPSSVIVSGQTMALLFDLQIAQSYTLAGSTYTISPVFNLSPVQIAAAPTNAGNGKITGLAAQITSVNAAGNSLVAQTSDGTSLTLGSNSSTQFQGVAGLQALAPGTLVNLDSSIQQTGTLLATRIQVESASAVTSDLFVPLGPASPAGTAISQPLECFPANGATPVCNSAFFMSAGTSFHVSGQMSNLSALPFTPVFDATSVVLGQSVSVAANTSVLVPGGMPATDVTLEPQTVNGVVTAIANVGGFTQYTVTIAPYHVIPVTQQQTVLGPFSAIPNPVTVVVYSDGGTQLLQSGAISAGKLLRFRGLLFNDGGTLRMDCASIQDGAPL